MYPNNYYHPPGAFPSNEYYGQPSEWNTYPEQDYYNAEISSYPGHESFADTHDDYANTSDCGCGDNTNGIETQNWQQWAQKGHQWMQHHPGWMQKGQQWMQQHPGLIQKGHQWMQHHHPGWAQKGQQWLGQHNWQPQEWMGQHSTSHQQMGQFTPENF